MDTNLKETLKTLVTNIKLLISGSIGNAILTIKQNNVNVGTFTSNATSNVDVNIAVPTSTSDLINDGEGGSPADPFVKQSEIVQSDWKQNDKNEDGFVKNRTHYETDKAIMYYFENEQTDSSGKVYYLDSYSRKDEFSYDYAYPQYEHITVEFKVNGTVYSYQGNNFQNGGGQGFSYAVLTFDGNVNHYTSTTSSGTTTYFTFSDYPSETIEYMKIYTSGKKLLDENYLPTNAIKKDSSTDNLFVGADGISMISSDDIYMRANTSMEINAPEINIIGNIYGIKKPISTSDCTPETYYCPSTNPTQTNPIVFDDTDFTGWYNYTFSGYFTNDSSDPMQDMPNRTDSSNTNNITWYGDGMESGKKYMFCATKISYTNYVGIVTKLD